MAQNKDAPVKHDAVLNVGNAPKSTSKHTQAINTGTTSRETGDVKGPINTIGIK
jgi:hypothetical protein